MPQLCKGIPLQPIGQQSKRAICMQQKIQQRKKGENNQGLEIFHITHTQPNDNLQATICGKSLFFPPKLVRMGYFNCHVSHYGRNIIWGCRLYQLNKVHSLFPTCFKLSVWYVQFGKLFTQSDLLPGPFLCTPAQQYPSQRN